jgi:hypothetical protein
MAETDQNTSAQQPRQPATQEMLDTATRFIGEIRDRNPQLADHVANLKADHADPIRANQREFQHLVAYATENAEKTLAGFARHRASERRLDRRCRCHHADGGHGDVALCLVTG